MLAVQKADDGPWIGRVCDQSILDRASHDAKLKNGSPLCRGQVENPHHMVHYDERVVWKVQFTAEDIEKPLPLEEDAFCPLWCPVLENALHRHSSAYA